MEEGPMKAADRIEELEAKLAVAGKALNRLLRPPHSDPRIEAATKEDWAVRAMNAEDKLEKMPKARDLGEANRMIQVLWCNVHEQYVGKRISQILAVFLAIAAILPWFF